MTNSHKIIRRAKRSLHYIAYGSLLVDVAVAFLTLALITHVIADPTLLFVANIILAITVAATVSLFVTIIVMRYVHVWKKLDWVIKWFSLIGRWLRMWVWQTKVRYRRWTLTRKRFLGFK